MSSTNATADFDFVTFEFVSDPYCGLRIEVSLDNAWVSDGNGSSWEVLISLPNQRGRTGWETQTREQIGGDANYDDVFESLEAPMAELEERFDAELKIAIEEWLEDKFVSSDCPRGFANEVIYRVHETEPNGCDQDCQADSLVDYLTREIPGHETDACRVELVKAEL